MNLLPHFTADSLATAIVTADFLATAIVTADSLATAIVTADSLATSIVTADSLATAIVTADSLATAIVTADSLATAIVTADSLATAIVTADSLATAIVTADSKVILLLILPWPRMRPDLGSLCYIALTPPYLDPWRLARASTVSSPDRYHFWPLGSRASVVQRGRGRRNELSHRAAVARL